MAKSGEPGIIPPGPPEKGVHRRVEGAMYRFSVGAGHSVLEVMMGDLWVKEDIVRETRSKLERDTETRQR